MPSSSTGDGITAAGGGPHAHVSGAHSSRRFLGGSTSRPLRTNTDEDKQLEFWRLESKPLMFYDKDGYDAKRIDVGFRSTAMPLMFYDKDRFGCFGRKEGRVRKESIHEQWSLGVLR
ncbi:hypothetical protein B296_00056976 [Ensete ventricosum]|uniref:Uncharacterized protein n=1 Tax=Ensete ventricosum TaxID=4639 RepID=A0A426X3G0_ENSVE|nr:hypothetical protein B296_00056976 [Ensete ventricosum]